MSSDEDPDLDPVVSGFFFFLQDPDPVKKSIGSESNLFLTEVSQKIYFFIYNTGTYGRYKHPYTHPHTRIHTHPHSHIHTFIPTPTYTHIHTYHTHTHLHT